MIQLLFGRRAEEAVKRAPAWPLPEVLPPQDNVSPVGVERPLEALLP